MKFVVIMAIWHLCVIVIGGVVLLILFAAGVL